MNTETIDIIPAQPGYYTVLEYEESYFDIDEPVIAWRVETYRMKSIEELRSNCIPLSIHGDVRNCVGVQSPNGTITVFDDSKYESINELNKSFF